MSDYKVVLFYKYVHIEEPQLDMLKQRMKCRELGMTGRTIIAEEGINGTYEGTTEAIQNYIDWMKSDPRFADVHWKVSDGTGEAFPKLSIKVRDEIVSTHLPQPLQVDPNETTGKYITAEELHDLIHSGEEYYIIDMRNTYEHEVGHFKGSVLPKMNNFRDLEHLLPELEHLKHKKVVTVCTGGIRCEKASGFLVQNGFTDVSQLSGGIVTYMETYPNEDFLGKLYVFDGRIKMGFHTDSKDHTIIGRCSCCGVQTEEYVDKMIASRERVHFLMCLDCQAKFPEETITMEDLKEMNPNYQL